MMKQRMIMVKMDGSENEGEKRDDEMVMKWRQKGKMEVSKCQLEMKQTNKTNKNENESTKITSQN